jgi:hypothetical protein
MIEILQGAMDYIQGLWTLPWILVGFIVTMFLSRVFGDEKVDKVMKKIGLVLLYFFIPLLLFKILLAVDYQLSQLSFTITCFLILIFMYGIAYLYAIYKAKKMELKSVKKVHYIKTVLVSQGRSSAFVGGAMLGFPEWRVFAIIYMIVGGLFLFAIILFVLSHLDKKEHKRNNKNTKIQALPFHLRFFPFYLLCFVLAASLLHYFTGITPADLGSPGVVFDFFTSLTIPAALYYVGSGVHIRDIKDMINRIKKKGVGKESQQNWIWTKNILFLALIITTISTFIIFGLLYGLNLISKEWFAVITINSIMPITSTNMFLIPYGINKKVTALSVTWTTIICVPIVVLLIAVFGIFLI